jgi:hypothetical protein
MINNDILIIGVVISLFVVFGGIIGIISHFITKYILSKF